ncbi:hypothetical protein Tco_0032722 [Tanacetum coccineum]
MDGRTKIALWDFWMKGGDNEVLMGDIVSSDDEWKESDNTNHLNDNANPIYGVIGEVLLKGTHFGAQTKKSEEYCSDNLYVISIKEDTAYLCLHFTSNHEDLKPYTPYLAYSIRCIEDQVKNILEILQS